MGIYAADFETTTKKEDCRVWAWGYTALEKPEDVILGTDLDSYMAVLSELPGTYYFHNLRFDGNFILYWLFKNGYRWVEPIKNPSGFGFLPLEPGEFSTVISDMGAWYKITVQQKPTDYGVSNKVVFLDSFKIIPLAIEKIPGAFNLEESKLEIDYNEDRPLGHELTDQEQEYIKADIIIAAKAIKFMLDHGNTKITAAANALNDFKQRYSKKEYDKLFPELSPMVDYDIRLSYKGGWSYVNPKFRNKQIQNGQVFDVNSMYPWAMKYCLLPWGKPVAFRGAYEPNELFPLYIINFECEFKLKPNHYPSLQLKGKKYAGMYSANEYIVESDDITVMSLTSVDYELFLENYYVENVTYFGGYMFKAKHGMFTEYVDYWYDVKTQAKNEENGGMEQLAKLMLNSLYGKFGARMYGCSKEPFYNSDLDKVQYKDGNLEHRKAGYLPIATFITSYCRDKIIRAANTAGDRFLYADTDSLHVSGLEPIPGLDVDNFRLGAFKKESEFIRARFIRQKTYIEIYMDNGEEKLNIKCCGMPRKMKDTIKEEDFYEGAVYDFNKNPNFAPKLMPTVVPGGVILRETTFQIKKAKTESEIIVY